MKKIIKVITYPFFLLVSLSLSDRAKRMILLSALYGCITKRSRVDNETLKKLNHALHLTQTESYEEGALVPLHLKSLIWDDKELIEIQESVRIMDSDEVISRLMNHVPQSLRYSDCEQDLHQLLNFIREQPAS